jgi:hypothetical protein
MLSHTSMATSAVDGLSSALLWVLTTRLVAHDDSVSESASCTVNSVDKLDTSSAREDLAEATSAAV